MPVLKFDFAPQYWFNPVSKKTKSIYRPLIPIRVIYNHRISQNFYDCLIDSGSDRNLFPADIALGLSINIKKGKQRKINGIGDVEIIAYTHAVKLCVKTYTFETMVDFSFGQKVPLLGRNGFFDKFKNVIFKVNDRISLLEY